MPFSENQWIKNQKKPLQAQKQTGSKLNGYRSAPFRNLRKRASASASHAEAKGSMTVEAAVLMSFFLLAVNLLFYFFYLMEFQVELQFAMERKVREAAIAQTDQSLPVFLLERSVEEELSEEGRGISLGKRGIDLMQAQRTESEFLDVTAVFEAGPPGGLLGPLRGTYIQRCRRRLWTGQESINGGDTKGDGKEDEYVYITQNGTVCHRKRECTYLRLSVHSVSSGGLSSLRNNSGGRYKPCERCMKHGGMPQSVYITDSGDRYHSTGNCSSLNRWIMKITREEAGGMPLCSRCGGS